MALDVAAITQRVLAELGSAAQQLRVGDEPELAGALKRMGALLSRAVSRRAEREQAAELAKPVHADASVLLALELPIRTFSEANMHEHHFAKHKKTGDQRPVVAMAVRAHALRRGVKVKPPCTVRLTRLAPNALDEGDNLAMSLKHVRDGVADFLKVNDRDPRVRWVCEQRAQRGYGVVIELIQ